MNKWIRNKDDNHAMVLAHRGAMGLAPENTIARIEEALKYNIDIIEIDVHLSKDNKLIVIHNESVDHTTNGNGFIGDLDSKYIRTLDAGIKFSEKFKGQKVPFLEEVMDYIKDKDVRLNIEIKNGPIVYKGIEEAVSRLVEEYNFYNRVIVSSFDHYVLKRIKEANKRIDTGMLYGCSIYKIEEYVLELEVSAVHPHYFWASPGLIDKMHKLDIAVTAWILNSTEDYIKYSEYGVDSIGTNFPNKMMI